MSVKLYISPADQTENPYAGLNTNEAAVNQAIGEALDQHTDGFLDEAELDEDDGVLRWKVELDDADRNDLVELELPAN